MYSSLDAYVLIFCCARFSIIDGSDGWVEDEPKGGSSCVCTFLCVINSSLSSPIRVLPEQLR